MSRMKLKSKANNPDAIEVTLTMTTTLGDWKIIRADLQSRRFPSFDLGEAISELVTKAQQELLLEVEVK